jgi:hypothetical protein
MALGALRDRLFHVRRMTDVAAYARDVSVFPSCRCYVINPGGMTLHAFFFFILAFCLGMRSA